MATARDGRLAEGQSISALYFGAAFLFARILIVCRKPAPSEKRIEAMRIDLWPISQVRPYANNPRINQHAIEPVAASIRQFGFRQPIVVDADGVIVCGHTRFEAAKLLGLETVPVHLVRDLTPEQIRAYRLADNKTGALATWDLAKLPSELAALLEAEFDLEQFGFSADELQELLSGGVKAGLTDPDDVPEPPDQALTQLGDCGSRESIDCSAVTLPSLRTWIS